MMNNKYGYTSTQIAFGEIFLVYSPIFKRIEFIEQDELLYNLLSETPFTLIGVDADAKKRYEEIQERKKKRLINKLHCHKGCYIKAHKIYPEYTMVLMPWNPPYEDEYEEWISGLTGEGEAKDSNYNYFLVSYEKGIKFKEAVEKSMNDLWG